MIQGLMEHFAACKYAKVNEASSILDANMMACAGLAEIDEAQERGVEGNGNKNEDFRTSEDVNLSDGQTQLSSWITRTEIASIGYLPSLDGLRAIALLGVMADHISPWTPWNIMTGSMGVTVFFVLSGFLITGILLNQQKRVLQSSSKSSMSRRYGHLPQFWAARFVRLFPALCVVVLVGSIAVYKHNRNIEAVSWNAFRALFSLQNTPYFDRPGSPFIFTWSLACEEQFYFFWAFLLPWLTETSCRQRYSLFALICTSICLRLYAGMAEQSHWLLSWNRALPAVIYKMLAGSCLQLLPFPRSMSRPLVARIGLVCLLMATLSAFQLEADPMHLWSLSADALVVTGTLLIITGTLYNQNTILMFHPLQVLGRISYAGYMWTSMIVTSHGTMFKGLPGLADTCLGLFCAMASTYWIEEPIRARYRQATQ